MVYKKEVTLKDLADRLGLSVNTVSKALRGSSGMSERTRQAVRELAERSGYRTKEQEHALLVERLPLFAASPKRFALVLGEGGTPLQTKLILSGLAAKLCELGHSIEPVMAPAIANSESAFNYWAEESGIRYYDGIFIAPSLPEKLEFDLLSLDMPRVLINFPPPLAEADSVIWDVAEAVFRSVYYLHRMGHERILYIGSRESHRGFRLRWQAFQSVMLELGRPIEPEQHLTIVPSDPYSRTREVARRLRDFKPTAVLCAIIGHLTSISKVIHEANKSIPRDFSLVSMRYNECNILPHLSGPVLGIKETGVRAAERMLWRIANPSRLYEHTLVRGGSGSFYSGSTVSIRR